MPIWCFKTCVQGLSGADLVALGAVVKQRMAAHGKCYRRCAGMAADTLTDPRARAQGTTLRRPCITRPSRARRGRPSRGRGCVWCGVGVRSGVYIVVLKHLRVPGRALCRRLWPRRRQGHAAGDGAGVRAAARRVQPALPRQPARPAGARPTRCGRSLAEGSGGCFHTHTDKHVPTHLRFAGCAQARASRCSRARWRARPACRRGL
jgi:hypothetical protein